MKNALGFTISIVVIFIGVFLIQKLKLHFSRMVEHLICASCVEAASTTKHDNAYQDPAKDAALHDVVCPICHVESSQVIRVRNYG